MAYSENLSNQIRSELGKYPNITEKKMFSGIAFMLQGNMACGVNQDNLIIRVGAENYMEALSKPHTRPFDMTGRPMTGWVIVETEGYKNKTDLSLWIKLGIDFASSLPAKQPK